MDPQKFKWWSLFINSCLALLIISVLAEIVFYDSIASMGLEGAMEIGELLLSLVLLTDLTISLVKAKDRGAFLRKNAIMIIAVLPWGFIFRALSFLRLGELPIFSELAAGEAAILSRGARLAAKTKEMVERL